MKHPDHVILAVVLGWGGCVVLVALWALAGPVCGGAR